jgi:hypothetical protein
VAGFPAGSDPQFIVSNIANGNYASGFAGAIVAMLAADGCASTCF